jgi:hypothetical protein
MNKTYQCLYLNPEYKLKHDDDAEVLFETDCLAEACTFVYRKFKEEGKDIAVYQPRQKCYREYYLSPKKDAQGKLRDQKGRFAK